MKRQYAVLAVGVVSISFAAIFIRLAEAPPLVIAAWRMCLAALAVTPVTLARSGEELRRLSRKDLGMMLAAGAFLAAHFYLWTTSLSLTSVATSVILVTANPVFVAIASYILFRETLSRTAVAGITVSIAGSVVIGYSNWSLGPGSLLGAGLALLGALTVAGYLLIGRRVRRTTGLLTYSFLTCGTAAVLLLAATLAAGYDLAGYPGNTWLMFVLLALVPQLIGHTSLNWSLRFVPATMVTVAVLGEPVVASALAAVLLGEPPLVSEIIGGILILGGIGIAFRHNPAG